jgi:hypothetical protein
MKSMWHLASNKRLQTRSHVPDNSKIRQAFVRQFAEELSVSCLDLVEMRSRLTSENPPAILDDWPVLECGLAPIIKPGSASVRSTYYANKCSFSEYGKTFVACTAIKTGGIVDPAKGIAFHYDKPLAPHTSIKDLAYLIKRSCLVVPAKRFDDGSLEILGPPATGMNTINAGKCYLVFPKPVMKARSRSITFFTQAVTEARLRSEATA